MEEAAGHEMAGNRLLAQLPASAAKRLAASLKQVDLRFGDVLHQPTQQIAHVYFPLDCLVSLLAVCNERQMLEMDIVGANGVVGVSAAWGSRLSPIKSAVLKSGSAIRLDVADFHHEYQRNQEWHSAIDRIGNTLLARVMQAAACSRYHVLEQRLARALLLIRDRLQMDQFHITHEMLSQSLGVRRVGVTKAAGELQQRKLISYNRGVIKILDAVGLEQASGGTYDAVDRIANGE
jgi:CRP-like cAMP-binding protein